MKLRLGSCAVAIPETDEPPKEIVLLPAGELATRPHDPRAPWYNRRPEDVVAASRLLRQDLPIDYEHQGERSKQNGQPAPAAGWVKRLFVRDGAVWGAVEWNRRAAEHIAAREYRFISPLFAYDTARNVRRLHGAALTNDPALYMSAMARTELEDDMDLTKLAVLLGLAADASLEAIETAAAAAVKGLADVAKALGLDETAAAQEVATAAAKARTDLAAATASGDVDPSKFVPREEFDRVSERLAGIETAAAKTAAETAVGEAVKAGKIAPASREWALAYAKKDPDGFATFVGAAPVIVQPGEIVPDTAPNDGEPSPEALAMAKRMGVSADALKASRLSLAAARAGR